MITEVTKLTDDGTVRGWVLYDADCALCVGLARRFERLLGRRLFSLAPLQAPWVRERMGWGSHPPLNEMVLLTAEGGRFGGADALVEIARAFWWSWPLHALGRLPGVMALLRAMYRRVAERRHCRHGACSVPGRGLWMDWAPLMVCLPAGLASRSMLAPWACMWALSFALFFGCKWLTWRRARREGATPACARSLGYLFAWPGMDAGVFLRDQEAPAKPPAADWWFALGKTAFGAVLIWGVVRRLAAHAPILAGWAGLAGIVFALHFGLFHLLALAWRRGGINAQPIMRAPARAKSPAEFWGHRWNLAFHLLVQKFAFRPWSRRFGRSAALLGVFLVSGLIHELVISWPAGGGYGLPTAYFLIQGAAVLGEQSAVGRRFGLGRGGVGWLFTVVVTAGPAFWLFHPPFLRHVILPFLNVIHAC